MVEGYTSVYRAQQASGTIYRNIKFGSLADMAEGYRSVYRAQQASGTIYSNI